MQNWADCVRIALGGWWFAAAMLCVMIATIAFEQFSPAVDRGAGDESAERVRTNAILGAVSLATQAGMPALLAPVLTWFQAAGLVGLLPAAGVTGWSRFAISLGGTSLAAYVLHRASHRWNWLWRLHRVHHADTALDVTTAFRSHPLEVAVSAAWHTALALAVGFDTLALAFYGVVALLIAIPQHACLSLGRFEEPLARWLVTPGLHHLHHSAARAEADSNFGEVVPWWDRLFGTLRTGRPMRIGLGPRGDTQAHRLGSQLGLPWKQTR